MINNRIVIECDVGEVSDGSHTFNELYQHRHHLFIALIRNLPDISWRARKNDDGSSYDGWFIAGIHLPTGDISYHMPDDKWKCLDGVGIVTTECAPVWDLHESKDVVDRLEEYAIYHNRESK